MRADKTTVWSGAAQLRRLLVPTASLEPHPRNPRRGDVATIAASLERFGQQRAILVQESTNYVVAGNHTLRAADSLGWTHVAAVVEKMDDEEATAYLLADNRASDLGVYDEPARVALLRELEQRPRGLEGTGYDRSALEELVARMNEQAGERLPDGAQPPGEFPEFDPDAPLEHRCPRCGYGWNGRADAGRPVEGAAE